MRRLAPSDRIVDELLDVLAVAQDAPPRGQHVVRLVVAAKAPATRGELAEDHVVGALAARSGRQREHPAGSTRGGDECLPSC